MGLFRAIRRAYEAHETLAKLVGVLVFLLIIASLYAAVLYHPTSGAVPLSSAATSTPAANPTDEPTGTPLAGTHPTPMPPIPAGSYQVTVQKNLAYGPVENVAERLDLCTPNGAASLEPGVVLIHGGGFIGGEKEDYEALCLALASHGFVVATLNYRLSPANTWPAPLVDVQLAVRWLRAHASDTHLDPQRLCALGDSAGGNLAVFLGVLHSIHPGDKASLLTDQSPSVSCVVDAFGPVDLTSLGANPFWQAIFPQLFGQGKQNNLALQRDASPLFDVTALSAPTLIIQGSIDNTVPSSQSLALQRALQQAGVSVSYISFPGGHEYTGLSAQQRQAINLQILTFLTNQERPS
jgi:acetyl esterase/lipase